MERKRDREQRALQQLQRQVIINDEMEMCSNYGAEYLMTVVSYFQVMIPPDILCAALMTIRIAQFILYCEQSEKCDKSVKHTIRVATEHPQMRAHRLR